MFHCGDTVCFADGRCVQAQVYSFTPGESHRGVCVEIPYPEGGHIVVEATKLVLHDDFLCYARKVLEEHNIAI